MIPKLARPRRWLALMVPLVAAVLVLAACGGSSSGSGAVSSQKTIRIGLVTPDLTVSTVDQYYLGAEARAKQLGNVQLLTANSSDAVTWQNDCERIINSGVSALIYSTLFATQDRKCVVDAYNAGLKIVCVLPCQTIGSHNVTISVSFTNDGKLIGSWMAKTLSGKGQVAILLGAEGDEAAAQLVAGFKQGLAAGCPACQVVAEAPGGYAGDTAYQSAQTVIAAHPNLAGMYSLNDDGALGALRAIQQSGKLHKIALAGHNGSCVALQNTLNNGGLGFTVLLDGTPLGNEAVNAAMALVKNQPVKQEVDVQVVPVDHQAAEGYLNGTISNPPNIDVRSMLKGIKAHGCSA